MKINEIIEKNYNNLLKYIEKNRDVAIANSKTGEDIFHDILYTAMNKFKDEDISEEDGLSYIKKTLFYEQLFQQNKKSKDKLIFTDDLENYTK